MKYKVGRKVRARITDDIQIDGYICKIEGGCYHIDWGSMGVLQYLPKMVEVPNNMSSIIVLPEENKLPENLFEI